MNCYKIAMERLLTVAVLSMVLRAIISRTVAVHDIQSDVNVLVVLNVLKCESVGNGKNHFLNTE